MRRLVVFLILALAVAHAVAMTAPIRPDGPAGAGGCPSAGDASRAASAFGRP